MSNSNRPLTKAQRKALKRLAGRNGLDAKPWYFARGGAAWTRDGRKTSGLKTFWQLRGRGLLEINDGENSVRLTPDGWREVQVQ